MKQDHLFTLIAAIAVIVEEVVKFFSNKFHTSEDDQDYSEPEDRLP
jgi:hypothetical protein